MTLQKLIIRILLLLTVYNLVSVPSIFANPSRNCEFSLLGVKYIAQPRIPDQFFTHFYLRNVPALQVSTAEERKEYLTKITDPKMERALILQRLILSQFQRKSVTENELWLLYGEDLDNSKVAAVNIKHINREIGYGVFANSEIKKGDFIGEYTGVYELPGHGEGKNAYRMAAGPFTIDAKLEGNETRFINHSGSSPNLREFVLFHGKLWRVFLVATQNISVGEQLLFDYGPKYWRNQKAPQEL